MTTGAGTALDQPGSRPARYLKEHRLRLAIWIGAVEGLLTIFVLSHYVVYVLAIVAIAWWFTMGRRYSSATARHLSWIFAASQAIAVLIPVILHIAKWAAITAVVIAAAIGLFILFTEREKP
jgi:FtsH-binding integral membrane protein